MNVVSDDGVSRLKTVRDSQDAPAWKPKAKIKEKAAPKVIESFTPDEVDRLLEKVAQLGRDQRKFGRRRPNAKRATIPSSAGPHASGFIEFVDNIPVPLSAVRKLQFSAMLSDTAQAATRKAEEIASEKLRHLSSKSRPLKLTALKQRGDVVEKTSEAVSSNEVPVPYITAASGSCTDGPLARARVASLTTRARPNRVTSKTASHSKKAADLDVKALRRGLI